MGILVAGFGGGGAFLDGDRLTLLQPEGSTQIK